MIDDQYKSAANPAQTNATVAAPAVTAAVKRPRPSRRALSLGIKPLDPTPRMGPFYCGAASSAISAILILALIFGLPMTMMTALWIVIPGMIASTALLSISMGWMFVMYGRTRQTPRWVGGTAVTIAITMAELFALTYIASLSTS